MGLSNSNRWSPSSKMTQLFHQSISQYPLLYKSLAGQSLGKLGGQQNVMSSNLARIACGFFSTDTQKALSMQKKSIWTTALKLHGGIDGNCRRWPRPLSWCPLKMSLSTVTTCRAFFLHCRRALFLHARPKFQSQEGENKNRRARYGHGSAHEQCRPALHALIV